MAKRVYEVTTSEGPFRFFCESKTLAADHARQLSDDPNFAHIESADIARVKFAGWDVEGAL